MNTPAWSDRFWSKVDKSAGPDACWIWIGGKDRHGYGSFRVPQHGPERAHRVAFFLTNGVYPTPFGCHRCDNPACCNPAHIFPGTHADNNADKITKGRQARGEILAADKRGDRNPMRLHPERIARGERHSQAKLTDATAREALARRARGETQSSIAKSLGVSRRTIGDLCNRKTWPHLQPIAGEGATA